WRCPPGATASRCATAAAPPTWGSACRSPGWRSPRGCSSARGARVVRPPRHDRFGRRGSQVSRLFISQERIDKLAADDRVVIEGDRLEIPALGATFRLRPAVHFVRLVSDDTDGQRLLGRVKTEEQLRALGAELF